MTGTHPVDRRRFLQIAGGAAAATALSSSVARAAEIGPAIRTRTIKDVEHIVVLMQENRSFDHYYGSLRGVRGFGDPHPALQPSGQSVWNQSGVLPFHPTAPDLGLAFIEDLPHGWNDTHRAWNGGSESENAASRCSAWVFIVSVVNRTLSASVMVRPGAWT